MGRRLHQSLCLWCKHKTFCSQPKVGMPKDGSPCPCLRSRLYTLGLAGLAACCCLRAGLRSLFRIEVSKGRPWAPLPAEPPIRIGASRACRVQGMRAGLRSLLPLRLARVAPRRISLCSTRAFARDVQTSASTSEPLEQAHNLHTASDFECRQLHWLYPPPSPNYHQVVGELEALIIFSDCIGTCRCDRFAQCGCMCLLQWTLSSSLLSRRTPR